LFSRHLCAGFEKSRDLFRRVAVTPVDAVAGLSKPYAAEVNYPQILQEITQQRGGALPTYEYVMANESRSHAPIFLCRAVFENLRAQGLGSTKREARRRAAYVLAQKLVGVEGNAESAQKQAYD
jgi:dsRNA-specific ribonuclease